MPAMFSYPHRQKSGQITCYYNRTYHVLTTPEARLRPDLLLLWLPACSFDLSAVNMGTRRQMRIVTAGWDYKDWQGILYPPELRAHKGHPLEYLAQFFDVV